MIGAGGQQGQGDAANLLKPALARGELRTIAATTWAEYKKYFEDDAALKRRFQVVRVLEPDLDKAVLMMRGLTDMLEKHHGVRILDEALKAMADDPNLRLTIEGYTCNIGTNEYNLALGDRRSSSVRDYLVSRGVNTSRLQTVSYGEERPKHDNGREETRRLNRRAALMIRLQ